MAFTEKPPILQGSTQEQLRALRDYLFRMASSLETVIAAPAVGTGTTVMRTRADGTVVTETGSAAKADTDAIRKSAAELRALIIKHANDLQDQIDTIELTTFYVKYADAFTGEYPSQMYNAPKESTEYMGVCSASSETAPTDPVVYTWSKIKGEQGSSVTVKSVQYGTSVSASTQPADWSTTVPASITKGKWLWVKTTYSDNTTAVTKSYVGTDGEDGKSVAVQSATKEGGTTTVVLIDSDGNETTLTIDDGQDGDNGQPGANGYVHTAWANSADGQTDFSTSVSTGKKYLGVYTDNTAADSIDPEDYSWSLIKGEKGDRGIAGPPGPNGQTTYLHIKYSDDGETFTLNPDTGVRDGETLGAFIGMYTDFTELDSAVFADYEWHRFADDEELKSMINDKETYLLNYIDSKEETYRGLFLAQSDFGTWERTLDSRIQTSAQGVVESYGFRESISSTQNQMQDYFTRIDSEIRRGYIENPDYPDGSSDEFIFGIAISSNLRFEAENQKSDGTYDYYHLVSGQTFGLYTSSGWQFWVDGNKRGYYNSSDQKLHVKDIVADDILQIGTDWQIKAFPDSQEIEFVYVGGEGT